MNSKNFFLLSFLTLLAGIIVGYYFLTTTSDGKRIAIFYPASHPAMYEIEDGFKTTLNELIKKDLSYDIYNANGDKTLMRAQAEEIAQGNYDITCTIGASCTQMLYELTTKKNITNPIVFTAVADPVALGIVQAQDFSHNHLTGITSPDVTPGQFDALFEIKPNTKQMLLVYDPTEKSGGIEQEKEEIERMIKKHGATLKSVQIYNTNEIQQKVQPNLDDIDVVLILKEHTAVAGVDNLIRLCNRYGVTLYASDLNSGDKGAALSYGVKEFAFGEQAAYKAYDILAKHMLPSQVQITPIADMQLKINTNTMRAQGLDISDEQLEKIRANNGIVL